MNLEIGKSYFFEYENNNHLVLKTSGFYYKILDICNSISPTNMIIAYHMFEESRYRKAIASHLARRSRPLTPIEEILYG